ncbi:MAG: LLM class flavin-dependent oxidoreductase, partial [Candidatus Binatia bacterium]|nr:LLM class flavin-dependent oxidoreductase [Candidatus Binatia bacterium]
DMFCRFGFTENADLVRDLYVAGNKQESIAAVSDDLVDAIAICGSPEHCRERLGEWRANGMGHGLVGLSPGATADSVEFILKAVAPA